VFVNCNLKKLGPRTLGVEGYDFQLRMFIVPVPVEQTADFGVGTEVDFAAVGCSTQQLYEWSNFSDLGESVDPAGPVDPDTVEGSDTVPVDPDLAEFGLG
jgi:hypothetical protein